MLRDAFSMHVQDLEPAPPAEVPSDPKEEFKMQMTRQKAAFKHIFRAKCHADMPYPTEMICPLQQVGDPVWTHKMLVYSFTKHNESGIYQFNIRTFYTAFLSLFHHDGFYVVLTWLFRCILAPLDADLNLICNTLFMQWESKEVQGNVFRLFRKQGKALKELVWLTKSHFFEPDFTRDRRLVKSRFDKTKRNTKGRLPPPRYFVVPSWNEGDVLAIIDSKESFKTVSTISWNQRREGTFDCLQKVPDLFPELATSVNVSGKALCQLLNRTLN